MAAPRSLLGNEGPRGQRFCTAPRGFYSCHCAPAPALRTAEGCPAQGPADGAHRPPPTRHRFTAGVPTPGPLPPCATPHRPHGKRTVLSPPCPPTSPRQTLLRKPPETEAPLASHPAPREPQLPQGTWSSCARKSGAGGPPGWARLHHGRSKPLILAFKSSPNPRWGRHTSGAVSHIQPPRSPPLQRGGGDPGPAQRGHPGAKEALASRGGGGGPGLLLP